MFHMHPYSVGVKVFQVNQHSACICKEKMYINSMFASTSTFLPNLRTAPYLLTAMFHTVISNNYFKILLCELRMNLLLFYTQLSVMVQKYLSDVVYIHELQ